MPCIRWQLMLALALTDVVGTPRAHAQAGDSASHSAIAPLVLIGGDAEDQLRLAQLRGASATGWVIRSPSLISTPLSENHAKSFDLRTCRGRWSIVPPSAELVWNSRLPFARNDGAMWSGRGASGYLTAGARARCGRFRVQFVPALWYAQNSDFTAFGPELANRSGFASPFRSEPQSSADIPIRFGTRSLVVVDLGQSAIEADAGPITIGMATEAQWWGPGIRNALVMSNNAAGIPNAYLRTRVPAKTPLGSIEARWMVGALSESPYFDFDESNDVRSISGLAIALRTALDTNLWVGGARVVYAPVPGVGALPARFLDVVGRWGDGGDVRVATFGRAAEQLMTFFGRWIFPRSGAEVYAEWARVILPLSLRSFLAAPQHTQGYTLGVQHITTPGANGVAWRVQGEVTWLEQPVTTRAAPPPAFYASPVVGQGYTQRGQVIGAAIGPGSSSQFFGLDRIALGHRVGMFLGRTRWDNEAFYRQPSGFDRYAHDVSMYFGLRGSKDLASFNLGAELMRESRLNYLFQNVFVGYGEDHTFDVDNFSLRLSLSPRLR